MALLSRFPRSVRVGAQVLLALGAFFAVATLVNRMAGLPPGSKLSAKLSWLAEEGEGIELVAFGSSRSAFNFVPRVFDEEAARLGWRVDSFNLADHGLQAADIDFTVREALRRPPSTWRIALIELRPFTGRFINFAVGLQRRQVYSHDARATFTAVHDAWRHGVRSLSWQYSRAHLINFAARATAAGRGPDVWEALGRDRPLWADFEELIAARGYDPKAGRKIPAFECHWLELYREHPERAAATSRRVSSWISPEAAAEPPEEGPDLGQSNLEAIRRQEEMLLRAGIVPIYYLPAVAVWVPDLEAEGIVRHALVYNDPLRHPEIYRADRRWDCGHLTAGGARIFSALVARDVAAIAREAGL